MSATDKDTIDFTMMYVTHDALRRDVRRLAAAAAARRADTPEVRSGWENFKAQLHLHHTVEDDDLWPRLYQAIGDRPDRRKLLEDMEAEHAVLDPLLTATDDAFGLLAGDELNDRLVELTAALDTHFQHEEDSALPLIQEVLTEKDWKGFGKSMAKAQGLSGAAVYVPWIVDGATPERRRQFFSVLPAPVKVLNRLVWEPRYRRSGPWATGA
jgi:hemerythrin-like domain-containing protein